MRNRIVPIFFLSTLLLGGAAAAADLPKRASVTLQKPTLVGATVLPAGTYSVELADPTTARFTQGFRTVAEAPVKVGLERAVYRGTALHTRDEQGQDRLVKVVLAPSGLAIEFASETAGSGQTAAAAR